MCSEELKEKKDEEECFHSEHFKSTFEMMNKGFKGEGSFDCPTIMKSMINQSCCGSKGKNTKTACS